MENKSQLSSEEMAAKLFIALMRFDHPGLRGLVHNHWGERAYKDLFADIDNLRKSFAEAA